MTFDAVALLNELSDAEVAFIVDAVDTNLLAYQMNDDPMAVGLIDRGVMEWEADVAPTAQF